MRTKKIFAVRCVWLLVVGLLFLQSGCTNHEQDVDTPYLSIQEMSSASDTPPSEHTDYPKKPPETDIPSVEDPSGSDVTGNTSSVEQERPSSQEPSNPQTAHEESQHIKAGIVFDVTRQEILYSKNIDNHIAPASLVKLLTACTALKYVPQDEVFTVGSELDLVHNGSSLCLIQKGHRLTLKDLLYGLLMASGNDAAYTIAVNTARYIYPEQNLSDEQAIAVFRERMNDFAKQVGLKDSYFTNPDGWDDTKQYTAVSDLLKIAVYARNIDVINCIIGCSSKRIVFVSGQNITWQNSNQLLQEGSPYYCPFATGMKTGTTKNAGKSLIASAEKDGRTIIAIGVGCSTEEDRYLFALHMFNEILNTQSDY